jgi:sodium pump decarboxylase gamma subunit
MYCVAQLPADMLKEQLTNGLILLALGMCIVFAFLFILVIVVKCVSAVINGGSKKKEAQVAQPVAQKVAPAVASAPVARVAAPATHASVASSVPAGGTVKAPMPGLILKINVKEGDYVSKNQLVMVMEAMKMENEIYAPYEGVVTKIIAALGNQVNADDPLMEIGASSASAQTTTVEHVEATPVAKSAPATVSAPAYEAPKAPAKPFVVPTRRTTGTAPAPAKAQKAAPSPRTTARPVATSSSSDSASTGAQIVEAPMPGLVLRFNVKEGDRVEKNQLILVLEAMKMENEVYAPKAGVLTKFFVEAGAQIEGGDKMFEIQ